MDIHDQGGDYYGVYFENSLTNSVHDGIELKPYKMWVQFNQGDPKQEPCSPYWTTNTWVKKKCIQDPEEYVITVDKEDIRLDDITTLKELSTSKEKPLWVRNMLKIPVRYNIDGLKSNEIVCTIKPKEDIDAYVKRTFHITAFAFIQSSRSVLTSGATCSSEHIYEFTDGFSVKSRTVRIKMQHRDDETKVDLSDCKTIGDVVTKLKGNSAHCDNNILEARELLDHVIMCSRDCFFLYIASKPMTPSFSFSQSISAAAKKNNGDEICAKTIEYGIYSHYLAIKLYDAWIDGKHYADNEANIVKNLQSILACDKHEILLFHETTYTSLLATEFQCLLKPYNCFHQVALMHKRSSKSKPSESKSSESKPSESKSSESKPSEGKPSESKSSESKSSESKPDFYCTTMDGSFPHMPLVVGEFKISNKEFQIALAQSFGYCMDVMSHSGKCLSQPIVAMPGTKKEFALYLCFSVVVNNESKLVTIEICKALVKNDDQMRRFLSALRCAVIEIAEGGYSGHFDVEPQQNKKLKLQLNSSRRVFKLDQCVYKLYNHNQLRPNIDVMNKISTDYFPMRKITLSSDGCIVAYVSEYKSQKTCLELEDFKPIMEALDVLHSNGYIHSDVRAANLLFPEDTDQEAKLIDFDLANKEGVPYPIGYNKINERHPDAIANQPRLKIHDRYSIISIIEKQGFYLRFSDTTKELLTRVKDDKCDLSLQQVFQQLANDY